MPKLVLDLSVAKPHDDDLVLWQFDDTLELDAVSYLALNSSGTFSQFANSSEGNSEDSSLNDLGYDSWCESDIPNEVEMSDNENGGSRRSRLFLGIPNPGFLRLG
jgi:hypothetical protein